MKSVTILRVETEDRRFDLEAGAGTDAVHNVVQYAFAVTRLIAADGLSGCGIVLTLGNGNEIVCRLIAALGELLPKIPIEDLMSDFGAVSRKLSDDASLRWLGPHKGAVHLALASLTNACFDLWAKARGVPLWRLLLDLSSRELVNLLDLSYLEEDLTREQAVEMIEAERERRTGREHVLVEGYPGYDTSVGWFQYDDAQLSDNVKQALDRGFRALKLKVGSPGLEARRTPRYPASPTRRGRVPDYARRQSTMDGAAGRPRVRGCARDRSLLDRRAHPSGRYRRTRPARRPNRAPPHRLG